jgi:hypothetical protein
MKAHELIELLSDYVETEVFTTSRIDQGWDKRTSITAINHVGHDKYGNLVISYYDNLVVKTQEDKDKAHYEAQAARDHKLIKTRALYLRQARKAREAYKAQINAKLARELTKARIDSLRYWEGTFLSGAVDDEHSVFIAEVLAEEANALQEENEDAIL